MGYQECKNCGAVYSDCGHTCLSCGHTSAALGVLGKPKPPSRKDAEIAALKAEVLRLTKGLDNLLVIRGRDGDSWADYNCVDRAMELIADSLKNHPYQFITCALCNELESRGLLDKLKQEGE